VRIGKSFERAYLTARPEIAAFDTETYKGDIKVITCSNGAWLEPSSPVQVLDFLWQNAKQINFFYNISFDAGAIFKPFLAENPMESGILQIDRYKIRYINGKGFSLKLRGRAYKHFFDISSFFHDGDRRYTLDEIARAFLGEGKTDAAEGIEGKDRGGTGLL